MQALTSRLMEARLRTAGIIQESDGMIHMSFHRSEGEVKKLEKTVSEHGGVATGAELDSSRAQE